MPVELHQFVSATLTEIIKGVAESQKLTETQFPSAAIAPAGQGTRDETLLNQVVHFDVGVTVQSGTETKGGIGIIVGPVTLGSVGKSEQKDHATNRVSFSVPVYLPSQKIRRGTSTK